MRRDVLLAGVLLAALTALGWRQLLSNAGAAADAFQQEYASAQEKAAEGLYHVALEDYQSALALQNSPVLWAEVAETCLLYYEQDPSLSTRNYVLAALNAGISSSPDVPALWESALSICLDAGAYSEAQSYVNRAGAAKVSSQRFSMLAQQLTYTYTTSYTSYPQVGPYGGGCFPVRQGSLWGQTLADGSTKTAAAYPYIGPSGADGSALFVEDAGTATLRDSQGIPLTRIRGEILTAGAPSEGYLWVSDGQTCHYVDTEGVQVFGVYEACSNFAGGQAAVRDGGLWGLLSADGTFALEPCFTDIKLTPDGGWVAGGRMLAQRDGSYQIYASLEEPVSSFSCDEIGIPTEDQLIAFCRDGLWGFVDADGVEQLVPIYQAARSFSNGLAAVCQDGLWGFIDRQGVLVIDYAFTDVGYFTPEGTCMVEREPGVWVLLRFVV